MAPTTPKAAAGSGPPNGSLSAPIDVEDTKSPPPRERHNRSVRSLPAAPTAAPQLDPTVVSRAIATVDSQLAASGAHHPPTTATRKSNPTSTTQLKRTGRKRRAPFNKEEIARLRLKNHQDTRRKQREQYFDTLAKEADATGNLLTEPRKIRNEDDLEKLELKRCFELLHTMGRASDPKATVESTRGSISGFIGSIFRGWDTSMGIPAIPGLAAVKVDAPAGRTCDQTSEHGNVSDCVRANTCKMQVRVCAVYDNHAITFTFYKIDLKPPKKQKPGEGEEATSTEEAAAKEARFQQWLNDTDSVRNSVEATDVNNFNNLAGSEAPKMAALVVPSSGIMNFDNVRTPQPFSAPAFNEDDCIDPLGVPNIRIEPGWRNVLKARLHKAVLEETHKQNKHRALWLARHMVVDWEKGAGVKIEDDCGDHRDAWGFTSAANVEAMLLALI